MTMASSLCLSAGLCVSWVDLMDRPFIAVNCSAHCFDLCALRAALLPRLLSLLCARMVSALRFRSLIRLLPLSTLRPPLFLVRDGLGWRWFRFLFAAVVCKVSEFCCKLSHFCTFFSNVLSLCSRFNACAFFVLSCVCGLCGILFFGKVIPVFFFTFLCSSFFAAISLLPFLLLCTVCCRCSLRFR